MLGGGWGLVKREENFFFVVFPLDGFFYGLVNASIILSGKYADLKLWGKNLLNQHYQAFYFETMTKFCGEGLRRIKT